MTDLHIDGPGDLGDEVLRLNADKFGNEAEMRAFYADKLAEAWPSRRSTKTAQGQPVPNKYHAVRTQGPNRVYASKKEAQFAERLALWKKAGNIISWIEQVQFVLSTGDKHRVDFMVIREEHSPSKSQYVVEFYEVKGYDTRDGRRKRRMVEKEFGIRITVV